jgi:hypothetical protein
MDDIYCGVGKPTEDKVRGTAKQCVDKGQVRYYGLKEFNPKLLSLPNIAKLKNDLLMLQISIRALAKKFKTDKEIYIKKKAKNKGTTDKYMIKDIQQRKKDLLKLKKRHEKAFYKIKEIKQQLKN